MCRGFWILNLVLASDPEHLMLKLSLTVYSIVWSLAHQFGRFKKQFYDAYLFVICCTSFLIEILVYTSKKRETLLDEYTTTLWWTKIDLTTVLQQRVLSVDLDVQNDDRIVACAVVQAVKAIGQVNGAGRFSTPYLLRQLRDPQPIFMKLEIFNYLPHSTPM